MRELTLLTWPDYISPETLLQFETEFRVSVGLEIVPSATELLERMRAPGRPAPDVLVPPDYAVRELAAESKLLPLDHGRLPNLRHLAKRFAHARAHDPESLLSVIKDWGTTGLLYRTDLVPEVPGSWADFWRLAESLSGRVTVLDSPGEVIGAALKMRGRSYNDTDSHSLAQAQSDLLALKPHLLAIDTNYRPLLASGEAVMSLGWNGDAAALKAQGLPIAYVVPIEGSQIWEDDWAIAAASSQPETAHEFLNFVLRPEVAAQEAVYTRYATGNQSALALLDDSVRLDASTYPPEEVLEKLEAGLPLEPRGSRLRQELWSEMRESPGW